MNKLFTFVGLTSIAAMMYVSSYTQASQKNTGITDIKQLDVPIKEPAFSYDEEQVVVVYDHCTACDRGVFLPSKIDGNVRCTFCSTKKIFPREFSRE